MVSYRNSGVNLLLAMVLLTGIQGSAQESGRGIGIAVGSITGVSFKLWQSPQSAWSGGAAWSFEGENSIHFHLDYLQHGRQTWPQPEMKEGRFGWYYGLGGRIKLAENSQLGMRVPVGMAFLFDTAPFDAFFEIAPLLDVVPSTKVKWDGMLGIRYFF